MSSRIANVNEFMDEVLPALKANFPYYHKYDTTDNIGKPAKEHRFYSPGGTVYIKGDPWNFCGTREVMLKTGESVGPYVIVHITDTCTHDWKSPVVNWRAKFGLTIGSIEGLGGFGLIKFNTSNSRYSTVIHQEEERLYEAPEEKLHYYQGQLVDTVEALVALLTDKNFAKQAYDLGKA